MFERRLRSWTGLILAVYVVSHLANHTLGLLSLDMMEWFRRHNASLWQTPVGTVALYGALLTHFLLALWSLYRRRTLRMPPWETTQFALGLLLPFLLASHLIGTRINQTLLGFDVTYPYVVTILWNDLRYSIQQPLLVLVVWSHLTVGMHFWLRIKPWYERLVPYLFGLAVLLPAIALLGFVRAGLESDELITDPDAVSAIFAGWNAATPKQQALIIGLEAKVLASLVLVLLGVLVARRIRHLLIDRHSSYGISHPSGQVVSAPIGQTILEAMRAAGIPHASVCGGRARCTTCRVRVGKGMDDLAEPSALELAALRRIGAAPNVRLACQTRPRRDVSITPLLPARADARAAYRPGGVQGHEQKVAAMFIDLRGSTKLGEERFPYDVVFILNQFFAEMAASLQATRGHYAQFSGDGLMALYGLESGIEDGCRDALKGAVEMNRRLMVLNERLGMELREPLRIGIGIHCGEAIVGTMGPPASPNFSAIGDNINIAARLEALTRNYDCTLLVSAVTAECAGVDLSRFPTHQARVRGRGEPVDVYAISDLVEISGDIVDRQPTGMKSSQ
ncbi:MAG: 2Fe-2S iron-sulfur cluster-binding protein [Gammaproteobacteria bacterium]|nr:2Fe-2S iron-sulfur cluster-binding protein [Gammaproteobacteria bacterium]